MRSVVVLADAIQRKDSEIAAQIALGDRDVENDITVTKGAPT